MYVLSEEDDLNAKISSLHMIVDIIQKPNVVKVNHSKSMEKRIESRLNVREKGTLPAQTQPNPKGQYEASNVNIEQAKIVTTLRNGKMIETPMKVHEPEKYLKLKGGDCHSDTENENSDVDKKMHAPFPHRLLSTKPLADNKDILDVLQQVKVGIPLLSVIKQIPSYAKFIKDLCTVKRKHNMQRKAFLMEQLGLGESKPTSVTLQLRTDQLKYREGNGIMNLSFGNMAVELNIFDAYKDTLEASLINLWEFDEDGSIEEVNSLLDSSPLLDIDKWRSRFESLPISETNPLPSSIEFSKLDLNPLPSDLKYVCLGQNETFLVIISAELNEEQEAMLLDVLRKHKSALGWTIADLKGIEPSIFTHKINMEENARPC
ncbi:uncharacterized protein LOC113315609 [Papaver somniferum]|uniref:uncharacterized protein LOC113315609 n=1 Tax=Papaver somniferum TaxID=3469 RepID=UPI000E6FC68C|nr:uncharacterized protein LOC113315609 [Papaver somniferum]